MFPFRKLFHAQEARIRSISLRHLIGENIEDLRKVKSEETTIMVEERMGKTIEQETTAEMPPMQDTMEDFWRPVIQEEYSAVRQPAIEANNFELKPALITMVNIINL